MKAILLTIILFILITPNLALAQTASQEGASRLPKTRTSTASAERTQAQATDRVGKGIERGVKEIDRRISSLNSLIERINAVKKLSTASKSTFTSQIQAEIESLETLKEKIQSNTDLETLKIDLQSIVKSYRIYALYVPKMRIFIAADRLGVATDNLSNYSATLSGIIDERKAQNEDLAEEEQLLSELNNAIQNAKSKYSEAVSIATPLLPTGFPDNKDELKQAQDAVRQGAQYIRQAFEKAVELRRMLRNRPEASPGPSSF